MITYYTVEVIWTFCKFEGKLFVEFCWYPHAFIQSTDVIDTSIHGGLGATFFAYTIFCVGAIFRPIPYTWDLSPNTVSVRVTSSTYNYSSQHSPSPRSCLYDGRPCLTMPVRYWYELIVASKRHTLPNNIKCGTASFWGDTPSSASTNFSMAEYFSSTKGSTVSVSQGMHPKMYLSCQSNFATE